MSGFLPALVCVFFFCGFFFGVGGLFFFSDSSDDSASSANWLSWLAETASEVASDSSDASVSSLLLLALFGRNSRPQSAELEASSALVELEPTSSSSEVFLVGFFVVFLNWLRPKSLDDSDDVIFELVSLMVIQKPNEHTNVDEFKNKQKKSRISRIYPGFHRAKTEHLLM